MKTVVITGASTGIGYACVEASLKAGHRVIATARKDDDLKMLADMGADAIHLELLSEESVNSAADKILALTDHHIDALFNNAGYGFQVAMEDSTWRGLNDQHTANVIGPIMFTNRLLDALKPNSRLIFNGSILGVITVAFRGPYCMSKHALEAAVDAYRLELEPRGINVHLIQPGPIEANFRNNTLTALKQTLGSKKTHLDYSNHLARLESRLNTKGTLPASSVADIYLGIVNGSHNKPRYLVTQTAKSAALFKRLLGSAFHRIAKKAEPVIKQ
ncbi:SDR family NAD(P)-dependent oxidoreductase [Alkalimarinus sediminis]|uniref:SDR family NAD(P)-dependent oxidoreductase n=1 Tax=Alkalimarinus sediminis TaxID=1632866 RepID=A0A9E8HJW0_9ALTE|nr:SDR family NAD(P)-dependent oxidoreductase [Alkalimarinus sediminis]UZW75759.1 SDR family NAD(P)-dependent oxidoreductase [Alkalimarinus sediminis]